MPVLAMSFLMVGANLSCHGETRYRVFHEPRSRVHQGLCHGRRDADISRLNLPHQVTFWSLAAFY